MRRTKLYRHAPGVYEVVFLTGKVFAGSLTFSNETDAEVVSTLWETSRPETRPEPEDKTSPLTLF